MHATVKGSSLMSCNPVCATPSVNSQQQPVSFTLSSVSTYLLFILQEIHIQSILLLVTTSIPVIGISMYHLKKINLEKNTSRATGTKLAKGNLV
jgi:hypothetical protein